MAETLISPKTDYGQVAASTWGGLTANWVPVSKSATEVFYYDTQAPVTAQTTVRIGSEKINNIYNGSKISFDSQYANKTGRSILLQCNDIYRVTGTSDGIDKYVPFPIHVVAKVPDLDGQLLTNAEVAAALARVVTLVARYPVTPEEGYPATVNRSEGVGLARRGIIIY